MPQVGDNWLQFTPRQPKRKRADLVCVSCNLKKIKCDLQARSKDGHQLCSNCALSGSHCQLRQSKRTKQKQNGTTDNAHNTLAGAQTRPGPVQSFSTDSIGFGRNTASIPAHPNGYQADKTASNGNIQDGVPFQISSPAIHAIPSSQRKTSTTPQSRIGLSHAGDVDTGFLHVYTTEDDRNAEEQDQEANADHHGVAPPKAFHDELLPIFIDTYFEYCYAFCPVLDPDMIQDAIATSPLLANAVALAASNVRPPLLPHAGPAEYYKKAKGIFYSDMEADSLTTLQSLSLFYWWAPRAPSTAHRHSSWWWTSIIIRIAQQMNIHREPVANSNMHDVHTQSLRRRVWWTAYARERLTALCQSKPSIIDPMDCTIGECQLTDFPNDPLSQKRGEIFIYWVRLCGIIGNIAQHLSRTTTHGLSFESPSHYVQELADWAHSLPLHLQLPIRTSTTTAFDRDVYQLHLPYLTTIIVLHLQKSSQHLPQAFPPAILAASCIARIHRDILSRGDTRFLMAITCWYTGTAYIALLQAANVEQFVQEAQESLDILDRAAQELGKMWGSARIITAGFDRLRKAHTPRTADSTIHDTTSHAGALPPSNAQAALYDEHTFDWTLLFPFVTSKTSHIAKMLFTKYGKLHTPADGPFREAYWNQYSDLLMPFGNEVFDFEAMMAL